MTLTDAIMVAEKTGSAKTVGRGGNAAGAKARDKRKTERCVWATCGRARRLIGIPYALTDGRTGNCGDSRRDGIDFDGGGCRGSGKITK